MSYIFKNVVHYSSLVVKSQPKDAIAEEEVVPYLNVSL